jgi:hypothetical protein
MIMYWKLALSFVSLLVLANAACAVGRTESGYDRDIGADHFAAGRVVEIATPVAGDAIAAGEGVTLSSNVSGDVVLAARSVHVDGNVSQNAYAAGSEVEVILGPNARITGALHYRSPDAIKQDPHAVVGGGVERLATPSPAAHAHTAHRVGRWLWIGLMVLAACLVAALPVFSARVSERVRKRIVRNMLLAFALIVCVPVATILLLATGIGRWGFCPRSRILGCCSLAT